MKCKYDEPWRGRCNQPCDDSEICEEHKEDKCHCGKQGVQGCPMTGAFVCGLTTCEECGPTCKFHSN